MISVRLSDLYPNFNGFHPAAVTPPQLLEASVAPTGSRSRISRGESSAQSDKKRSSFSSFSSLESCMAGYFASLSDSPEMKRRKQEAEMLDAKRRLKDSEICGPFSFQNAGVRISRRRMLPPDDSMQKTAR